MLGFADGCTARVFSILTLSSIFLGLLIPLAVSAERGATSHRSKSGPTVDRSAWAPTTKSPDPAIDAWRATMTRTPRPKQGCFTATYPNPDWQEVPCTTAPRRPYQPAGRPTPHTVGHGVDFSARTTQSISSAVGSFDSVVGITSLTGPDGDNSYSLQLNTIQFATSVCDSIPNPTSCQGFQQFIYSNSGELFMQLWLLNFGSDCPTGFFHFDNHPNDCTKNSDSVTVPVQPLANLGQLRLTGTAVSGGLDTITLSTGSTLFSVTTPDSDLNLASNWKFAEFNIFGDCCGSQVNFNAGAAMTVRISVDDGSTNAPTCFPAGFTAESNNLNLVRPCCPFGGVLPAIVFRQSSNPDATSLCSGGTSIGDTHLTNFNGVLYDFQASGDFLLAETDSDFVVQTRQQSGAPRWPNASVNKAVAMKMGDSRVALCLEPNRLIVNGMRRSLGNGMSLSVSDVTITRKGNVYLVKRPRSGLLTATLHDGWINVAMTLDVDTAMAKVRGLLGNANGNAGADDLASRVGAVLPQPISFANLYRDYGESWRIQPRESLLTQLCGAPRFEAGIPERPFYANDLNRKDYNRARSSCVGAGVTEQALLDACILDTVVLGDKAATEAFVRANPPRHVLQLR